jgi:exonuclease 1
VDYVVAPYEADAQLAYLERIGLVDGIITEDSDLLVFGCQRVLYKLDPTSATLTSISRTDFASIPSLRGWSDAQFRAMAILSGCDYLASVQGVGLKTAAALLRKHRTLEGAIRALQFEGRYSVPRGYTEAAKRAERVFLYQRVYDPVQNKLIHLTPLPDNEPWTAEDEADVGEYVFSSPKYLYKWELDCSFQTFRRCACQCDCEWRRMSY